MSFCNLRTFLALRVNLLASCFVSWRVVYAELTCTLSRAILLPCMRT